MTNVTVTNEQTEIKTIQYRLDALPEKQRARIFRDIGRVEEMMESGYDFVAHEKALEKMLSR